METTLCVTQRILHESRHFDTSFSNTPLALPAPSPSRTQSSGSGGASAKEIVEKSLKIIINKEVQLGAVYKDP